MHEGPKSKLCPWLPCLGRKYNIGFESFLIFCHFPSFVVV